MESKATLPSKNSRVHLIFKIPGAQIILEPQTFRPENNHWDGIIYYVNEGNDFSKSLDLVGGWYMIGKNFF